MSLNSFKNIIIKMCSQIIYLDIRQNLALNNQEWLICHTTKPNLVKFPNT